MYLADGFKALDDKELKSLMDSLSYQQKKMSTEVGSTILDKIKKEMSHRKLRNRYKDILELKVHSFIF